MRCADLARCAALAALLAALLAAASAGGAVVQAPEPAVKAEFAERFTRYVEWPAGAFSSADAPFTVCVAGRHPIAEHLERWPRERRVKERKVAVVAVAQLDDVWRCHLLFVAATERPRLGEIVARAAGRPVLTVADTPGFAERGVLINLYVDDGGFVRFEINLDARARSPLQVSPRLLRLARPVRED